MKLRKIAPLFASLFLIFLLDACDIAEPVAPTWKTAGTIQLIQATFNSLEILEDADTTLQVDNFGRFVFVESTTIDTVFLGDSVNVENKTISGDQTIDSIKISGFDSDPLTITGETLNPDVFLIFDGQNVPVPEFNFQVDDESFSEIDDYDYALLRSNQVINLVITNQLPVPIDELSITLSNSDPDNTDILSSESISSTIGPGESTTLSFDLGRKKIYNEMAISFTGTSSGSGGESVSINKNSGIIFQVRSGPLLIREALATFDANTLNTRDSVDADVEDFTPTQIVIKTGQIVFNVNNDSNIEGTANIRIPELFDLGGQVFSTDINIRANRNERQSVDISGYEINLENSSFIKTLVTFDLDSTNEKVLVNINDKITYDATIRDIKPKFAKGMFKERIEISDADTTEIDLPKDLVNANLEFDQGSFTARITNSSGIPASVNPRIIFSYKNGTEDSVIFLNNVFPFTLDATPLGATPMPQEKSFSLSDIPQFNSIFQKNPTGVRVYAEVIGAPGGYDDGYVEDLSKVTGSIDFKFPIRLKSAGGYSKDSLYSVDNEDLAEIKGAQLHLNYVNKVPFRINFSFDMMDSDSVTILASFPKPGSTQDVFQVRLPQLDQNGKAITPARDKILITLSDEDIRAYEKAAFIRLNVKADTRDVDETAQFIQISDSDEFNLTIFTVIDYQVNEP